MPAIEPGVQFGNGSLSVPARILQIGAIEYPSPFLNGVRESPIAPTTFLVFSQNVRRIHVTEQEGVNDREASSAGVTVALPSLSQSTSEAAPLTSDIAPEGQAPAQPVYVALLEKLPLAVVACTSVLYSAGFIVVNSFFATKGQTDLTLVNAKYLMAGAMLCVLAAMYYFVVFRKILSISNSQEALRAKYPAWFYNYLGLYLELEVYFSCALWACWIVLIFLPTPGQSAPAIVAISIVFLLDTWLFWNAAMAEKTYTKYFVSGAAYTAAAAYFGWHLATEVGHSALRNLFFTAIVFSMSAMWMLTSNSWRKNTNRPYGYTYLGIAGIIAAAAIGAFCYGSMSQKFGGGLLPRVEVLLAADTDVEVKALLSAPESTAYYLAGDKDFYTFLVQPLKQAEQVIKVDRAQIKAVIFTSQENQSPPFAQDAPASAAGVVSAPHAAVSSVKAAAASAPPSAPSIAQPAASASSGTSVMPAKP